MKFTYNSLPKRKMLKKRYLLRTVQFFCMLGPVLIVAANILQAQPAPPARSSEMNTDRTVAEIRAVIQAQQEAWTRGNIDAFMNGYARSDSTVFVSGDTVARGWQTVRARYKMKYISRAKMGTLTFSDLEIQPLGNDAAVVFGRWETKRVKDNPHGHFTLVFRRTPDGWRIVHDHTSTAPE
jgi:uncharacterized protein (TIGR02246 family)